MAGLPVSAGEVALVVAGDDGDLALDAGQRLRGSASGLALSPDAARALVILPGAGGHALAALATLDAVVREPVPSYAAQPRVRLSFAGLEPRAVGPLEGATPGLVRLAAAVLRANQIVGALRGALSLTVGYVGERHAFGRPLAKFQAIQHNLARLASDTAICEALALTAAEGLEALLAADRAAWIAAASAKIRAGEAAQEGARIAHQAFGALGFTAEHPLHRYSHSLWAWRDDFGSEGEWARQLGRVMAQGGAAAYWQALTTGLGAGVRR